MDVNAHTIAMLARAPSTTFDEAVSLIQKFADTTASHAVIHAVEDQYSRTMRIIDSINTPVMS